jgi:hypothetical protein
LGVGSIKRRRRADPSYAHVYVDYGCDLSVSHCKERVAIVRNRSVVVDGCDLVRLRKSYGYGDGSFGIRCGDEGWWKWEIENEPELSEIGIPT